MKNILYVLLGLSLALNGFAIYRHFQRKHQMQNCSQHCFNGGCGPIDSVQNFYQSSTDIFKADTSVAKKDIRNFMSFAKTPIKGAFIPNALIKRILGDSAITKFTGISIYYGLNDLNYNIYLEGNSYIKDTFKLGVGKSTDCYRFFTYCPKSCGSLGQ